MELKNCRSCGKMFSYISGAQLICPACRDALEEKFAIARSYLRENKGAGIREVAEAADVRPQQVEKWIREERLIFSEDSAIGIACENCGTMIRSGRYCDRCKANLVNGFSGGFKKEEPKTDEPARKTIKMRHL